MECGVRSAPHARDARKAAHVQDADRGDDRRVHRKERDGCGVGRAVPGARATVVAYYADEGPPLRDLLQAAELQVLDTWLSSEVRRWAREWHSTDPARAGSTPSTRAALGLLVFEIEARQVPEAVMTLMARASARARPAQW